MIKKWRKPESGRSSRNSWMRSPGDDDRTPPELRPGSNSGHPTYSDSSRRNSSRTRHLPGTLPGHTVSLKLVPSPNSWYFDVYKRLNFQKIFFVRLGQKIAAMLIAALLGKIIVRV